MRNFRKTLPRVTMPVLFQIFLCSLTGATGNQVLYFVGLENSTPTIACALSNILPAVTFILATIFRQEAVGLSKASGQAKVVGTIICVGGAMILSFYHGHVVDIGESRIQWDYAQKMGEQNSSSGSSNFFLGPFLLMGSSVSWAAWFIIQARMSEKFEAPYTSTLLMCFMGSLECGLIAVCADHNVSEWSLRSTIRLVTALYAGIVASGLGFSLISWSIQKKGALYVSVFSPLLLVVVAIMSWALLGEKIYVGSVVGSVLVVGGLYVVLWGKDKEMKQTMVEKEVMKEDMELQMPASNSNGLS